jgi:hypothetical protein
MGHWLAVELAQDGPNRDAVGSWIEVRTDDGRVVEREVTVGGGHIAGQLGPTHFGLGTADRARVTVTWPDGEVDDWGVIESDRRVRLERGGAAPVRLRSAAPMADRTARAPDGEPEAPALEAPLEPVAPIDPASCVKTAPRDVSVARLWDEALLGAIRRDFPAPTVHARNLYHLSAAMWDAWAVWDPVAVGVFVTEKLERTDPRAARKRAISYAAYRLLSHRYRDAVGGTQSLRDFDALMAALCYPTDRTTTRGDAAAAVGNRIAAAIIAAGHRDGAREAQGYTDPGYAPVNEPLIVALAGTTMVDPDRWQPLALELSYSQNGQPLPLGPQAFIGSHWGGVTGFALPPADARGLALDPGPPPRLADPTSAAAFRAAAVEVLAYSRRLDPRDGVVIDHSPASLGANPLGTNDGTGYTVNPVTGAPYPRNRVNAADFGRVVAEFWADGPDSETPPGHWNTLANAVTDTPGFARRLGGVGPELDPLEWDVKLYLALNGALHDAAVAAWGAKAHYDYARPISIIRYLGGLGQSSDPDGPAFHPDGLPLSDDLVEVITPASAAPGARHAHLADHVGELAVRAWTGAPEDHASELGGVDWIRAVEWVPYQLPTFVTPAFAGYVSGHSTFSRAAAEVLTAATGSPWFPGGLGSWTIPAGALEFEAGPSEDVELQWASYADAADQAGLSRLYGGIHVAADDLAGRFMGAECGLAAWDLAARHFDGRART